jgi:hypothetical protein
MLSHNLHMNNHRKVAAFITVLLGFALSTPAEAGTCSFLKSREGTGEIRGSGFDSGLRTIITVRKKTENVDHQVAVVLLVDANGRFVTFVSSSVMDLFRLDVGGEVIVGLDGQVCETSILSGFYPSTVTRATPEVFQGDVTHLHRLSSNAGQSHSNPSMSDPSQLSDPVQNFDGAGPDSIIAHDPVGDVGPNHYVQMINTPAKYAKAGFSIFDKRHNLLAGPSLLEMLWRSNTDSVCRTDPRGDPIVLYDPLADRWLLSQMALGRLCVALSATGDPTGRYFLYDFDISITKLSEHLIPDYFKLGVWPDGYYMSAKVAAGGYILAAVFDRVSMLDGMPAGAILFGVPVSSPEITARRDQVIMPSDFDGSSLPPLHSPNFFYRPHDSNPPSLNGNDWIEIWQLQSDWRNPDMSTFTGPPDISTFTSPPDIRLSDFDLQLCDEEGCVPQPETKVKLEALDHKPMWRFQYRNCGSHETLVGNFTVDVDGQDHLGIRWFELRRSGNSPWMLYQEGTYAPQPRAATSFVHRWMGSIAMDRIGNIALGYSVSSATDFPSIRYTGRLPTDPLGELPQPERTVTPGFGHTDTLRWGDYSSLNVDPSDDCTFWYTNDYVTSEGKRQTRIASFSFSSCGTANSIAGIDDQGYPNLPRQLADVNGDGRADYCRFVGDAPNIFLSCNLATANGFDTHQYTFNSIAGIDPGCGP